MRSRAPLVVLVAVAGVLLSGCGGGGSRPTPTVTATVTASPSPTCPTAGEFFQAWIDAGQPNRDSDWWGMYLVGCSPEQIDDLLDQVNGMAGES